MIDSLGKPVPARRVKRLELSTDLILEMLKIKPGGVIVDGEHLECTHEPIPLGAVAVGCQMVDVQTICLLIEDESFDLVEHGSEIGRLIPQFTVGRTIKPGGDVVYDSLSFAKLGDAEFVAEAIVAVLLPISKTESQRQSCGEVVDAMLACLDRIVVTPSQYEALNEFLQNRRLEMLD